MIDDPFASSDNLPPGLEPPPPNAPDEALSWVDTMIKALTQPNERGYTQITHDPGLSIGRAALWYTLSALFSVFISLALSFVFNPDVFTSLQQLQGLGLSNEGTAAAGAVMVGFMLCFIPFAALLSTVFMAISAAIHQLVARLFGGQGSFSQVFYAYSAFMTPINPVATLIGSIPLVNCLGLFIWAYMIYLRILSVKAANRIGWGAASVAVIVPGLLVFVFLCCLAFVIAMALGPEVEKYFQQMAPGQF